MKAFFNEAHQASGTQARALAHAVMAYAQRVDRLDALAGALPRIVQKHAALGIQPEHYPIVGKCLLQAIREVLGNAATDEVIDAWRRAYQSLADLLIAAEEEVYATHAAMPGGWRGERTFRVARRQVESELITSFHLEPVDISMLESVASSGRPIRFVHAARHGGVHAFRSRVDESTRAHPNVQALYVYDQPRPDDRPHATGVVDTDLLAFLGPKPFMQQVYASGLALGIPPERLRCEFFGPSEPLQAA